MVIKSKIQILILFCIIIIYTESTERERERERNITYTTFGMIISIRTYGNLKYFSIIITHRSDNIIEFQCACNPSSSYLPQLTTHGIMSTPSNLPSFHNPYNYAYTTCFSHNSSSLSLTFIYFHTWISSSNTSWWWIESGLLIHPVRKWVIYY